MGFIDNSNICAENLFEDGLHLSEDAKMILANNFIYILNTFILWHKKICNGTSKNNSLLKSNFYSNNDEPSMISNSSEVK